MRPKSGRIGSRAYFGSGAFALAANRLISNLEKPIHWTGSALSSLFDRFAVCTAGDAITGLQLEAPNELYEPGANSLYASHCREGCEQCGTCTELQKPRSGTSRVSMGCTILKSAKGSRGLSAAMPDISFSKQKQNRTALCVRISSFRKVSSSRVSRLKIAVAQHQVSRFNPAPLLSGARRGT